MLLRCAVNGVYFRLPTRATTSSHCVWRYPKVWIQALPVRDICPRSALGTFVRECSVKFEIAIKNVVSSFTCTDGIQDFHTLYQCSILPNSLALLIRCFFYSDFLCLCCLSVAGQGWHQVLVPDLETGSSAKQWHPSRRQLEIGSAPFLVNSSQARASDWARPP